MGRFLRIPLLVISAFFLVIPSSRGADWVFGTKLGYESNVIRSVDDEKGDSVFSAYAAYDRSPSGETRLEWTLRSILSGSVYSSESDFNSITGTVSPGFSVHLNPSWDLNISPYFRGKAVSDSEQSAIAWGLRATLTQKWHSRFYSGEYYNYTDSNANEDVYSYCENAVGVFAGVNWTRAFFTEIGYEYAHGDSFVSTSRSPREKSGSGNGQGQGQGSLNQGMSNGQDQARGNGGNRGENQGREGGRNRGENQDQGRGSDGNRGEGQGQESRSGYSSAFDEFVVKDTVDRHSYGINVGYSFSKSLLGTLEYTYSYESGSVGSVVNHSALVGLEYRF